MSRNPHKVIRTSKRTKRARFSTPAERHVSGWDGSLTSAPRHNRLKDRRDMGIQQVPKGPDGTK